MNNSIVSKKERICITIILVILGIIWVFPLIFAFLGSMKTRQEYNLTNFWQLPEKINWIENYKYIVKQSNIFLSIGNSLLYAIVGTIGSIVISSLAAYGIAKLHIKRKMFYFLLIYSGTIFPFQLYLIPVFSAYQKLGLYDTQIGLMLFYIAICIPFAMFLLRNHFMSIPNEVMESAFMDGASKSRILFCIFLPMSKAQLAVLFMTQFAWCFNDLMFGLTFIKTNSIKPVMATIASFSGNTPALLVACTLVSIPTIIFYALLNRHFNTGMTYQSK